MFDPRDLATDPRKTVTRPRRDHAKEREQRQRNGHRREYDPRTERQTFAGRMNRAVADVGMYRSVAYRDLAEAHFDGHPYAARRAVDRMVRAGHVREHTARGPQGGPYKVLTLTERGVERAERVAREQGLDKEQKAWSGLVKQVSFNMTWPCFAPQEWSRCAYSNKEPSSSGSVSMPNSNARSPAPRKPRERGAGRKRRTPHGSRRRRRWGSPSRMDGWSTRTRSSSTSDIEGRTGRVNVEIATEHYSTKSIGAKAAAGFAVHGSNGRAVARVARALGQDHNTGGGSGRGRDEGSIEL